MNTTINYFAYGHNANIAQFKKRIHNAQLLGTATLWGWKLEIQHFANIIRDAASSVRGVLYSMPKSELTVLDRDEAYHVHYNRTRIKVDISGEQKHALAYVMTKKYHDEHIPQPRDMPTVKYIRWVAQGYRENHIGLAQLISALEEKIAYERR